MLSLAYVTGFYGPFKRITGIEAMNTHKRVLALSREATFVLSHTYTELTACLAHVDSRTLRERDSTGQIAPPLLREWLICIYQCSL